MYQLYGGRMGRMPAEQSTIPKCRRSPSKLYACIGDYRTFIYTGVYLYGSRNDLYQLRVFGMGNVR